MFDRIGYEFCNSFAKIEPVVNSAISLECYDELKNSKVPSRIKKFTVCKSIWIVLLKFVLNHSES